MSLHKFFHRHRTPSMPPAPPVVPVAPATRPAPKVLMTMPEPGVNGAAPAMSVVEAFFLPHNAYALKNLLMWTVNRRAYVNLLCLIAIAAYQRGPSQDKAHFIYETFVSEVGEKDGNSLLSSGNPNQINLDDAQILATTIRNRLAGMATYNTFDPIVGQLQQAVTADAVNTYRSEISKTTDGFMRTGALAVARGREVDLHAVRTLLRAMIHQGFLLPVELYDF